MDLVNYTIHWTASNMISSVAFPFLKLEHFVQFFQTRMVFIGLFLKTLLFKKGILLETWN